MNKEKKECVDDLKYTKKAYKDKTLSQQDAFMEALDILIKLLESEGEERGETF